MNDSGAKQQIVDKIKSNSNILVTVSTNPSVDELSAALGLTLLLNKMNKHATAVFSGAIPPAITFLDPEKTFENTVDSLRDFIIALDKEKADHLRYKVEGDVVKIFITPYRTTITNEDLDFSQGDYNVELVLALGVKNKDYLDGALAAHGRILHDAVVVTMGTGEEKSELGSVDWREDNASSLSEMLVLLTDALKSGDKKLLDEQIATAFLTGIVAATDRFSNDHTTSKVMTMAAQLMSAGANQQLIASKLEEAHEIGPDAQVAPPSSQNSDGTVDLSEGESTKVNKKRQPKEDKKPVEPTLEEIEKEVKPKNDGSLTISHEKQGTLDEVAEATVREGQEAAAKEAQAELEEQTRANEAAQTETSGEDESEAAFAAEQNLARQLGVTPPAGPDTLSVADLQKDLAEASAEADEAAEEAAEEPVANASPVNQWQNSDGPSMGGTLNATTEQAAEDKRREEEGDRNRTILSHNSHNTYVGDSTPTFQSPLNAASQPEDEQPMVDPFKETALPPVAFESPAAYVEPPKPETTLADIDRENRAPHEDARAAVDAAFGAVPFIPTNSPSSIANEPAPVQQTGPSASLPPLPPLPDFSTLPPLPPSVDAPSTPVVGGALPPEKLEDIFKPNPQEPAPLSAPQSNDPAQFKIPGQN